MSHWRPVGGGGVGRVSLWTDIRPPPAPVTGIWNTAHFPFYPPGWYWLLSGEQPDTPLLSVTLGILTPHPKKNCPGDEECSDQQLGHHWCSPGSLSGAHPSPCPGGAQVYREDFGEVHFLCRDPESPGKCSHILWGTAFSLDWWYVLSRRLWELFLLGGNHIPWVTSFYLHSSTVVWG